MVSWTTSGDVDRPDTGPGAVYEHMMISSVQHGQCWHLGSLTFLQCFHSEA